MLMEPPGNMGFRRDGSSSDETRSMKETGDIEHLAGPAGLSPAPFRSPIYRSSRAAATVIDVTPKRYPYGVLGPG